MSTVLTALDDGFTVHRATREELERWKNCADERVEKILQQFEFSLADFKNMKVGLDEQNRAVTFELDDPIMKDCYLKIPLDENFSSVVDSELAEKVLFEAERIQFLGCKKISRFKFALLLLERRLKTRLRGG